MTRQPSLLESVQGLLERTYDMRTGLDPARFVIGEVGFRSLYGAEDLAVMGTCVASPTGDGARTLVRETGDELRMSLFLPGELIRRLEEFPPQHGLCQENVDGFAVFVEELDHLLSIAERFQEGRPVSRFELELHANVSKHLVLSRFMAVGSGRPGEGDRQWLRHQLFGKCTFTDTDSEVRVRYQDALRWAVRFLDGWGRLEAGMRLRALRRFHAADLRGKLEQIRRSAA